MHKRPGLLVALFSCLSSAVVGAEVELDRLNPVAGLPGSRATLYGQGFQSNSRVQINGSNAPVVRVVATEIEFTIPAGTATGPVAVEVNGSWYTNPAPFTITRPITGVFTPPPGLNRAGFRVVASGDFVDVDPVTGQFTGAVAMGQVAVVSAFRSAADPAFLALTPPGINQVSVDAASTAEALVMLNPLVNGLPLARYTNLIGLLRQRTELAELASLITGASAGGRDYLDDPRVLDSWQRTIQALLSNPPPALARNRVRKQDFEDGTPRGTRMRFLDAPDTSSGNNGLRRLKASITGPSTKHPDTFRLEFDSAGRFSPFENPLDWFIKIYEVDPAQFAAGFTSVDALASTDIPLKVSPAPMDTATVSASLVSKYLDVLDFAVGYVVDKYFSGAVDPRVIKPNETDLGAARPGIYVAEAYSGNVYYGTELFKNSPPSQSQLITDLNGRVTWAVSLGGNVTVAAVDLLGTFGGFVEIFKKARAASGSKNSEEASTLVQIMDGVVQDVIKGLSIHGNQPASKDTIYDFVKGAASSMIKNMTAKALEDPGFLGEEYGEKILKGIGKSLDVMGKVSSALQAVERSSGLFSDSVLAVERTMIVVGDPFGPKITSFFPQGGRGGETLTIQGANFGTDTNELRVSFRQFANTADPTSYTARLDLPLVSATDSMIAVLVPTNGPSVFANLHAFVVVERGTNSLITSSASLNPPFQEFRFLGLPSISSVFPNPVGPGALLELRGAGFDNESVREHQILIDGVAQTSGWVADDTHLAVVVPPFIPDGTHQIALRLRNFTTPNLPFQVLRPPNDPGSGNPSGVHVTVELADFSNAPDGKISVLEGILIGRGELGRPIQQHLPCEFLPSGDPSACPFQEREIDHVSGTDANGQGGGAGISDVITFKAGLIIPGPLPALSSGDRYAFGSGDVVDGSSAGAGTDGLVFDGINDVYLDGALVIRNFSGHGVVLRNGAQNNFLGGIRIQNCGGSGFFLEGTATMNRISFGGISNVVLHGVHLSGAAVRLNQIISPGSPSPFSVIANCGGSGIRLDAGANFNTVIPGTIRNSGAAGIHVSGAGTARNFFGWLSDELARKFDLVNNNGPGAYLGPGAVGNTFRYLNPIGNHGDGVLLEGPGCSNNIVDRTFAGPNLYEGGTSPAIGNEGSGIHLASGAQFNLIGSRIVSFGGYGSICGNRDDGVLLEGADTAFNTVNAQLIGVFNPFGFPIHFNSNGRSGIALRGRTHDNVIGDPNIELANYLFACPDAGIELTGAGTDRNLVFGNQIGAFSDQWTVSGGGECQKGIWIHSGPRANIIGMPGARLQVPGFPGDPFPATFQCWNAVNVCTNAGILVENAGGDVGTDGTLAEPNVIQANHVGELDNGTLAPSGQTGIKLGTGAQANVIGGPSPLQGNRIRGWRRAGFWIDQNVLPSDRLRNRIENNFIEGPGTGVFLRYTNYTTATPPSGIGFLVTDSSGHTIGESQQTRNTIYVNRLGFYLGDSSSNVVQGFFITNSFNAGLVVRGGGNNIIGGNTPVRGNVIHAFGLNNEPGWAGLTLSATTNNQLRANQVGYTAPGRGAVGVLITNAANNELGGPAPLHGNSVVSNTSHGLLLTGPLTAGNRLFNNFIGRDPNGIDRPNLGDGVRLESGAHDNFIGGDASIAVGGIPLVPSPVGNLIMTNGGAGVRVSGATTIGNRILNNRITRNGDRGIVHETGGNLLMPPPVFIGYDGTAVSGTVASLAVTPPGSIVQVFTDPDVGDPEGENKIGVATVGPTGAWRAVLTGAARPVITMTATHAVHGSTSEFGTGTTEDIIGFRVTRTDIETQAGISAGATRAAVLRLSLNAINADVRVKSMAFETQGTLPDTTAINAANLYRDFDTNGVVTDVDFLLAGPATFTADDGRITLTNINAVIDANSTQRWILAYSLAPGAPVGTTFQSVLTNADVVSAEFIDPIGVIARPVGPFPLISAQFTVGAQPVGQSFASWQAGVFTPAQLAQPQISGATADPDGDGLPNILEYAFNLDPLTADRNIAPTGDRGIPRGAIVRAFDPTSQSIQDYLDIAFVQRKEPADLIYRIEHSTDLQNWADALAAPALLTVNARLDVGPPGTLERITYRTSQPIGGSQQHYFRVRVQLE